MSEAKRFNPLDYLERTLPKLVIAPSFMAMMVFIYGFILWTVYISMSKSTFLPNYDFVGLIQYVKLWRIERWYVACKNLLIYGGLFISVCIALGLLLAIFLDQKIRLEGVLRSVYLYPLSLSFVVTGTAWRWMLNPGLGLEKLVRDLGWESFKFDWLVNSEMAIYTVVIAAVWQSTGFVMAMFLAGLRGFDSSIIKAAQVDGASLPRIYWKIIIPSMRPVFFGAVIILTHIAIKSFDLVVVLTRGGPGYSTDLPATFMYAYAFTRGRLALGAASATMMFMMVMAIIIPYLYSELRSRSND
ncbi:MAG: sugar ABC transporter permease [Desulfofustis sp.]|nr:sugar ABC transporter permease [Desulfofustis sp.]RZW24685.1 MAG: sugar ABC transporter permease [Desulfobulbaceae bacterium]MBT8354281.1 sugar ABC transporter permease [Desulfofustis sp.]NNF47518.1 sugar ABC transporter permease [Desulfofustis sp.]NNK12810.1 sugar ABC transporter permease [Desulfofustis sp.]